MIWKHTPNIDKLNEFTKNTLDENLGIRFMEAGDDYLIARLPVDHRTVQPFRILHGGASMALAESLGSTASALCLNNPAEEMPVGLEINGNHLRPGTPPFVYGKVSPVRIGRKIHVWNIEIRDEEERLVCVSRITIAIVKQSGNHQKG